MAVYASAQGGGGLLGAAVTRARDASRRRRVGPLVGWAARWAGPLVLPVVGLACFVVAAFLWAVIPGLVALGVALLLLDGYNDTPTVARKRLRR